jgi:hypothetical protein
MGVWVLRKAFPEGCPYRDGACVRTGVESGEIFLGSSPWIGRVEKWR